MKFFVRRNIKTEIINWVKNRFSNSWDKAKILSMRPFKL
jgi:hypothetical protein